MWTKILIIKLTLKWKPVSDENLFLMKTSDQHEEFCSKDVIHIWC